MNKKIIISLTTIAAIAIIAIGATTAYFSNTETSTGNTFIAGAIDLKIDNECHYNGNVCEKVNDVYVWTGINPYPVPGTACDCTWEIADWEDGTAIFTLTDIKPGDEGEDTISLHVDSNPAWICAEISNVTSTENGCTEPEGLPEGTDVTCDNPGAGQGELWSNLYFSIWMDDGAGEYECNNIKDEGEDYLVENVPATNLKYAIADSQTGDGPIQDTCIGVEWYVPSDVGNIIQGDGVTGDITFNAYQARHNERFVCFPPPTFCGNGQIENGEECDDNGNNGVPCTPPYNGSCNYCSTECKIITLQGGYCGDGNVENGEECDGSAPPHYTCEACKLVYQPYCGDNHIDPGEQCDGTDMDGYDPAQYYCNASCQAVQRTGTVTIHKVVNNYEVCTNATSDFQVALDNVNAAQDMKLTVLIGSHTVSEPNNLGYIATIGGDCAANGSVTVGEGENKVCTITNDCPYFTVTVTKVVNNVNGGNNVIGDFNLFVGTSSVTSGVSKKVAVGTHLISESGVGGYVGDFTGDCDASTHLITGVNGDNKTCTITNTDLRPNITLIKVVNGGSATSTDFIMRVDDIPVPTGGSISVTSNTGHTITEDLITGYTGTISGNAKCPATLGGTATLDEGEAITCTITNNYTP